MIAFFNRKAYHHIVLSPEDIKRGGLRYISFFKGLLMLTSFFAVYKASSAEEEYFDGPISYDINVKTSGIF